MLLRRDASKKPRRDMRREVFAHIEVSKERARLRQRTRIVTERRGFKDIVSSRNVADMQEARVGGNDPFIGVVMMMMQKVAVEGGCALR
jgi:hypothetical protein